MKKGILYFLFTILIFKMLFLSSGCANIIPPTGGPRDTLPPVLVQSFPKDSSLNFKQAGKDKKITLYFNEYVELQNARDNLIISPTTKTDPITAFKLHTITITIKDTLDANTTYSINFGKSIRDVNEGNEYKNFTYVFSTGSRIDSNKFSGHVSLAESGKIDSTLIVLLYLKGDDSAVVKERPRYYTRVNNKGNFTFRFLPEGTFYVYALKDEGNRRYMSTSQLFGFLDKPVVVGQKTESDTLYAYSEANVPIKPSSGSVPVPTVSVNKGKNNTTDKRLVLQTSLDGTQQDLLSYFTLQFANPLKTFDTTKILFTDYRYQPLKYISFSGDSLNKKFTLRYALQPDSSYRLILDKNFAEDSAGRKLLKIDTIQFKAKKTNDYATVRLRFPKLDLSKNPVLQFVQSEKVVDSSVMTTREFNRKLFKPGDYEMRILYDRNKNGKWDPGSFFGKRLQPERVFVMPEILKAKAGFSPDNIYNFDFK